VLRCAGGPGDLPSRAAEVVGRPIAVGAVSVRVGVSVGAASVCRGSGVDRDALIGRADAAMYEQKADHRAADRAPALH
jgi:GGDEF domain-containing protein